MRRRLLIALALAAACLPVGLAAAAGPEPRIVGGHPAPPGAYPWTVALVNSSLPAERGQFCGGSLIEPDLVLTAAHCVAGRAPREVDVVVGRYRLAARDGERIESARIASNPLYAPDTQSHDAALIELAEPATQPTVTLATPADAPSFAPGRPARVMGWGTLKSGGVETADVLYETDVTIDDQAACEAAYSVDGASSIDDTMICASAPGRDSCQGDSGGPLVVDEAAGWRQVGIVSFGTGCADPAYPGVYARVPVLLDFIRDPDPVWAPAPTLSPFAVGNPVVGGKVNCRKGHWVGDVDEFFYGWFRIRNGEFRQQISADKKLRPTDRLRGWRIGCIVQAANDGGYAQARSGGVRVRGR